MAFEGQQEPLRPDIKAAQDAKASIKAKLVYRDEEELDTGVQKVQPLPYLDEEIQKYHAQIRESVEGSKKVNDYVPSEVLQRVDKATTLAQEGTTSLFKASQLLEFTFDAYQYARGAAKNDFDLKRECEQHLTEFEQTFKNGISYRLKADLDQSEVEFDKCRAILERTLDASERDVRSQEERAQEEDVVVQEASLQESHEQVQDMIRMERSELSLIGEQCVKDINSINEGLASLQRHMDQAKQRYVHSDNTRKKRLEENRSEQRELKERLRKLEEEEASLERALQSGVQLQQQAEEAHSSTKEDILEWRSKIEDLRKRTHTSLSVISCMEECTDIIMKDAKTRKNFWKRRLQQLAVECQWMLREGLLAKGAMMKMVLEENQNNAAESKKLIAQYEKEKMAAARNGFLARVEDVRRSIERFTESKNMCDEKVTQSSEILQQLRKELEALDKRLHTLRPGLKLDTLEKRYDELKQKTNQAFTAETTDGIIFGFYHKLPRGNSGPHQ